MISKPTFLQGAYPFEGSGLHKPAPLLAGHVVDLGRVDV